MSSIDFSLLNLPILALEHILHKLNVRDIIDFSLCNAKCKQIVKSMKHSFTGIDIDIGNINKVCLKIGEEHCFKWAFTLKTLPRGSVMDENELRNIGGMEIRVRILENNNIESTRSPPELQIKIVYDYLQELFNLPISNFKFNAVNKNQNLLPDHFGITKCEEMHLKVGIPGLKNHIHIQNAIENVKVTNRLCLNLENFRWDSARFSIDELDINPAQWISRNTFLSLNCSRVRLSNVNLSISDLKDFIIQWLSSDNTRLQWLSIKSDWNMKQIGFSSKFEAKSWDPEARGQYYELNNSSEKKNNYKIDCSDGMDISRSDGLMATIIYRPNIFYFLVWNNNRFSNCEHLLIDEYE